MRWTLDTIAARFLEWAEYDAYNYLGESDRRPMPVDGENLITREDYNHLVRFVREQLG